MAEQQHPITPPQELINKWRAEGYHQDYCKADDYFYHKIAQWGWQQRADLRPKPPSLKEQALAALNEAVYMADDIPPEGISTDQADIIRRALESLPEEND